MIILFASIKFAYMTNLYKPLTYRPPCCYQHCLIQCVYYTGLDFGIVLGIFIKVTH